ncbi:MAG: hypothetical protein MZV49_18940 [Rhodopseudomonas palustris]|nr:hypothetical protein [Rhodopseudomonas palustris]
MTDTDRRGDEDAGRGVCAALSLVVFLFLGRRARHADPDGRGAGQPDRRASSVLMALGYSANTVSLLAVGARRSASWSTTLSWWSRTSSA